jgi:predicted dehydrogenase
VKLRGALLGCGNIALRSHAPQWAGEEPLRREVEIVAIADISESNRDAALKILPGARAYASAEDLLDREELDFCDICTPPFTHLALIEQAARRGRHVICEKPLASTPEDADRIVEAVRAAGIVFQPCHQYHYSPQWLAVRAALPRIGRLYFAEYEVLRTSANPGNANWSPAWRTDPALAGGGILADHGAHVLYQLHAVLGPPQSVQATVRTLRHHSYKVEDTALVTLEYADALAQMRLTWAAQRREISFRFVGEAGELVGDDAGLRIHAGTTEEISFDQGMSGDSAHAAWYAPLLRGFVDRVRAGDRGTAALEEAAYVTRLVSRAYESAEQGRSLSFSGLAAAMSLS